MLLSALVISHFISTFLLLADQFLDPVAMHAVLTLDWSNVYPERWDVVSYSVRCIGMHCHLPCGWHLKRLVPTGVDVSSLLSKVGINVNATSEKVGTAAIAYAAHKALSPVRFPPTVALTPVVARFLGKGQDPTDVSDGPAP